tara:strand:+ start:5767 stop:6429 length:663 start_codon:yes stop_codon:yes gene_type:complete
MTGFSEFEEMYLKRIFEVHSETPEAIVKTTQLADLMQVTPASTTEMIGRLSEKGMVTHVPYKGCRLTPEGFQLAARIKRREGLLQILLSEVIGFSGDVYEAACKMEHTIGDELEADLDRLLGFPERTMDGTRIPAIERSFDVAEVGILLPITNLPEGSIAEVELILASEVERVTLYESGIEIGSRITNSNGAFTCEGRGLELSSGMSFSVLARVIELTED